MILQITPSLEDDQGSRAVFFAQSAFEAGLPSFVLYARGTPRRDLVRKGIKFMPIEARGKQISTPKITSEILDENISTLIRTHSIKIAHIHGHRWVFNAIKTCHEAKLIFDYGARINSALTQKNFLGQQKWREKFIASVPKPAFLTLTAGLDNQLEENLAGLDYKKTVIPLSVDTALYNPSRILAARMIDLSTKWRLSDGIKVILLDIPFAEADGYILVLQALSQLNQKNIICLANAEKKQGARGHIARIKGKARRYGLKERLFFTEHLADRPALLMLSDLVIIPTGFEGASQLCLEAQAMGRPLIVGEGAVLPGTIIPESLTQLVSQGDSKAISALIASQLELDEQSRKKNIETGQHYIGQHFNREIAMQAVQALYRDMLDE